MSDVISIANKLWINEGGKIMIPGCEPISELTSVTLANNIKNCGCSEILATKAVTLVPGSYIEINPFDPTMRFFVLPNGPPPDGDQCPKKCAADWYAMLRCHAEPTPEPAGCDNAASIYNYGWCPCPELSEVKQ